ncbi:MAG TPA: PepSY-associated TM helix domain-containing protein, partial [Candidatus Eisenbacteria bacterium]|nr:PepSY-associated TM helix domain-containing protein [Candidatus Eisenbacteria bacterium]
DGPVTFFIQEPVGWHPSPRSQLVLDPVTADVVKWEPFAGQNMGRRLRAWVRPLHTGEAAGLVGQTIAFFASAGGTMLVWTGLALAWRRFRGWRRRAGSAESILAPDTRQEVSAD